MPEITRLDRRIKSLLAYKQNTIASINSDSKESTIQKIDELIDRIRVRRDTEIDQQLCRIISKVTNNNYTLTIHKEVILGNKPIYLVDDEPESYFALKHLQYCLGRLYKVKQSNRSEIISQLAGILDDNFPKYIYRTDVENFYESIPEVALNHIRQENLLSRLNKRLLIQVMEQYYSLSGSRLGIPRGIGVSAYLAELFMREFDRRVSRIGDLVFYRRYVDDMIFIFAPRSLCNISKYEAQIDGVFTSYSLNKSNVKSKSYGLTNPTNLSMSYKFDFLGYNFHFSGKSLFLGLSKQKYSRILARMDAAFADYDANKASNKRTEDRRLFKRLSYLAGNTKLHNRKSNILIGIYYSNPLLNCYIQLKILDRELSKSVDFAKRLAAKMKIPFVDSISINNKDKEPVHRYENSHQIVENSIDNWTASNTGRTSPVLLVDDFVNSRWTMTIVGRLLRMNGVEKVYPFALGCVKRRDDVK